MTNRVHIYLISLLLVTFIYSCQQTGKQDKDHTVINYRELKIELEYMYDRDQEIRRILIDSIGFDSPEAGIYIAKMLEIDSINQLRIVEVLDTYGWLPISKIGEKASSAIFAVVQHSDQSIIEKYFPLLKKLSEVGEADKVSAAMMEDRLLMYNGKKQKYGSQATSSLREDGNAVIWPIQNPDSVNILRAKVGFDLTVEENAKRLDAEYNPEEALPDSE